MYASVVTEGIRGGRCWGGVCTPGVSSFPSASGRRRFLLKKSRNYSSFKKKLKSFPSRTTSTPREEFLSFSSPPFSSSLFLLSTRQACCLSSYGMEKTSSSSSSSFPLLHSPASSVLKYRGFRKEKKIDLSSSSPLSLLPPHLSSNCVSASSLSSSPPTSSSLGASFTRSSSPSSSSSFFLPFSSSSSLSFLISRSFSSSPLSSFQFPTRVGVGSSLPSARETPSPSLSPDAAQGHLRECKKKEKSPSFFSLEGHTSSSSESSSSDPPEEADQKRGGIPSPSSPDSSSPPCQPPSSTSSSVTPPPSSPSTSCSPSSSPPLLLSSSPSSPSSPHSSPSSCRTPPSSPGCSPASSSSSHPLSSPLPSPSPSPSSFPSPSSPPCSPPSSLSSFSLPGRGGGERKGNHRGEFTAPPYPPPRSPPSSSSSSSFSSSPSNSTGGSKSLSSPLCPKEMVAYLDKYIIGQADAKRAVAVALRQRWRRRQIHDEKLREDITPKNILLIGPTGVGKTEVARRLARHIDAPFIKVEATKFTEVGFHGRDVDQIVKDLVEIAMKNQRSRLQDVMRPTAVHRAEQKILEALLGNLSAEEHQQWLRHLRCGDLDSRKVHVDIPLSTKTGGGGGAGYRESPSSSSSSSSGGGSSGYGTDPNAIVLDIESILRDMDQQASSHRHTSPFFSSSSPRGRGGFDRFSSFHHHEGGGRGQRGSHHSYLTVKEARLKLMQAELDAMITKDMVVQKALETVEQEGIVFIDEIDKICSKGGRSGYSIPDASDEGVQRDLLPLIEGTTISTRYGDVKTDYILFIASGAFHCVRPSDMLAELQGRLPIRVTLKPLTQEDLQDILTKTKNNLIEQSQALLKTENIDLHFTDEAIREIARVACEVNANVENIGARRLHTIIEKIMEDVNFSASSMPRGSRVEIDLQHVQKSVSSLLTKMDYTRFVL